MEQEGKLVVVFRNNVKDGLISIEVDGIEVIQAFSEEGIEYFTQASGELVMAKIMVNMGAEYGL